MKRKLINPTPFLTLGQEYEVSATVVNPVSGTILVYVQGHWYRDSCFSPAEEKLFPYALRELLAQANQVASHAGKRARWGAMQADRLLPIEEERRFGKVYLDRYFKEEERIISTYGTKESTKTLP